MDHLDWMDEKTKERAKLKLDNMEEVWELENMLTA